MGGRHVSGGRLVAWGEASCFRETFKAGLMFRQAGVMFRAGVLLRDTGLWGRRTRPPPWASRFGGPALAFFGGLALTENMQYVLFTINRIQWRRCFV